MNRENNNNPDLKELKNAIEKIKYRKYPRCNYIHGELFRKIQEYMNEIQELKTSIISLDNEINVNCMMNKVEKFAKENGTTVINELYYIQGMLANNISYREIIKKYNGG